jgi:hypothetical protein
MYGVINRAIEEMIILHHGEEKWHEIRAKARVDIDVFISNESYSDEITYKIAGASAETLGISLVEFLRKFGQHWMLKTGQEYYGSLLRSGGATFKEFLLNIPQFLSRVQLIYPELQPPEFNCSDIEEHSMRLHYFSNRSGLADFVIGLVQGLANLYKTSATVTLIESKAAGADHDVFEVEWTDCRGPNQNGV